VHPQLIDSLLDDAPYLVGLVDRVGDRIVLDGMKEAFVIKYQIAKIRTDKFCRVVWQH